MRTTFIVLIGVAFLACANERENLILGHWQCTEVSEEGVPLEINFDAIKFHFRDNGTYQYQSTLKYREKGSYYLNRDLLYTTDTLDKTAVEKVVRIIVIDKDSMHLKMNEAGNERVMKLVRG